MIVLGIETSCDDTSAAIFNGKSLQSNVISTQLIHQNFGGVVPELASRSHIKLISPVIKQALAQADCSLDDVNGLAVTYGPGLAGSLLVGLSIAKGLALAKQIPLIGVNHLEGHIWANRLTHPHVEPPMIVLIASGGHTQLVHVKAWGEYAVLGRTRDDAAGEAFDKVSKLLQLGYPGGPLIESLAEKGKADAISFPRAYLSPKSLDFSFSGLKTAVLNYVQKLNKTELRMQLPDIAASFQEAVIEVLVRKTILSAVELGVTRIGLSGGVAINKCLRKSVQDYARQHQIETFWPEPALCSDNAGMIARAGYHYLQQNRTSSLSLAPTPSLNL